MELTSKKAILHGFIAGDGSIDIRREKKIPTTKHYEIRFYPDHKVLSDLFISTFDEFQFKSHFNRFTSSVTLRDKYCSDPVSLMEVSFNKIGDHPDTSSLARINASVKLKISSPSK